MGGGRGGVRRGDGRWKGWGEAGEGKLLSYQYLQHPDTAF